MAIANDVRIDRLSSAERIRQDVEAVSGPHYSLTPGSITRYAYSDEYRRTLDYFSETLSAIGFQPHMDPVGTLVCRNRPQGETVFGLGSHCDSVREGGKWDGTLGVAVAAEVARLSHELGLNLPLQIMSFLEEDGAGFGQVLLGSRIMAQRITDDELRSYRSVDDGRTFWEHATQAGYHPDRWPESLSELDDVVAWIETHIEQGRVLQEGGYRLGIVTTIASILHGDVVIKGRADHAGATPMTLRADAGIGAAECVLELERLASTAGHGTVGTVGEMTLDPNVINAVPGMSRISVDVRSASESVAATVVGELQEFASRMASRRGLTVSYQKRQRIAATPMDRDIVGALDAAAAGTGEPTMRIMSGGAHDTMCLAEHVPVGMLFVPCKDGISHSPLEQVETYDAAVAVETILNALRRLERERQIVAPNGR